MNRSPPKSSPQVGRADPTKEERRAIFDEAIKCLKCRTDLEEEVARPFLYLIARRVRQAYRRQTRGLTRSELRNRLLKIEADASALVDGLRHEETREALGFAGHIPLGIEGDLEAVKKTAKQVLISLNLTGQRGSDRAAHQLILHARPLSVMYLKYLFAACSRQKPTAKNSNFCRLLSLVWEFATREPETEGWDRHIRAAAQDLDFSDDSEEPKLTGGGPGTPFTFLWAYMDARDYLVNDFLRAVDRRRGSIRQSPKKP